MMSNKGSIYKGILHRKARGSLELSETGFKFCLDNKNNNGGGDSNNGASSIIELTPWNRTIKHQVSPASHPKSLLKILVSAAAATDDKNGGNNNDSNGSNNNNKSFTFVFPTRNELESARKDITARLRNNNTTVETKVNKKRPRSELTNNFGKASPPSSNYITHDPMALITTRSTLLASDPALRAQHRLLVLDNATLTEEDFWKTHHRLVADEYAKICGRRDAGMSSNMKSSLDLGLSIRRTNTTTAKEKKNDNDKSKDGTTTTDKSTDKSSSKPTTKSISSSSGVIHLGVEEIRQIFLMYPAVHRAYEEKVPLELSEEQFWRKYLESEYFHRDRGRMGAHVGRMDKMERLEMERRFGSSKKRWGGDGGGAEDNNGIDGDTKKKDNNGDDNNNTNVMGEDEANTRLAAAGTDDLFSRYERGLVGVTLGSGADGNSGTTIIGGASSSSSQSKKKLDTIDIAIGQFDLSSTAETERGKRFLSGMDLHPPPEQGSQGSRIIDKYNRHWAIVLHPGETTAGMDLSAVAAKSVAEGRRGGHGVEEDANVNGGTDREMRRLIGFADADEGNADFARCTGDDDAETGNGYSELHLSNIDAYRGKFGSSSGINDSTIISMNGADKNLKYAQFIAKDMRANVDPMLKSTITGKSKGFCHAPSLKQALPNEKIGRPLLEALTKKMAADSQTDADVQQLAESLPEDFRNQLATFFRRSTELLRHFFSLRSVFSEDSDGNGGYGRSEAQKAKLSNIVKEMEKEHRKMYELTRNLPVMESKMFKPIMDQLDWAFKLHREDDSKTKGGFVAVTGFVPVET